MYGPQTVDIFCIHVAAKGDLDNFSTYAPWCKGILPITCSTLAAQYGNINILAWMKQNGHFISPSCYCKAAGNGHKDVIIWLHENGIEWDTDAYGSAIRNCDFDLVKWLLQCGFKYDEKKMCDSAATSGNREFLEYLHERGFKFTESAFECAAAYGDVDILIWLRKIGCPWGASACAGAARYNKLPALKWLHENGCEWDQHMFSSHIEIPTHFKTYHYAIDNGWGKYLWI